MTPKQQEQFDDAALAVAIYVIKRRLREGRVTLAEAESEIAAVEKCSQQISQQRGVG